MSAAAGHAAPSGRWRGIFPALGWLRSDEPGWFRADLAAGVTLAACLLPAALGESSLAGLPPEAGLYACLFGGLGVKLLGEVPRGIPGHSLPAVDWTDLRDLLPLALAKRGIPLCLVEARSSVRDMLRVEGVEDKVGRIDRFTTLADAIDAFQSAAPPKS